MERNDQISRRDALGQIALLLGAAISAPTLAGVLGPATRRGWMAAQNWTPRALSPDQLELVAVMADHILPATDTPGARAAGVHRFVDVLLSDHYPVEERDRFLAGLADVDQRARARHSTTFVACKPAEQVAILTALDEEAFPEGTEATAPPQGWFFHRLKEVTLVGYYTSQIGATTELHVTPFGSYRGDIPYTAVGRAWA
jgi:glucoside 3-dehydrogenase (cytochrome c) hitch-hiker subunit